MISAHVDSHESLPDVMLDRLLAAKNFQAGMQMVRQLEFSLFDFRLHHEAHTDLGIQGVLDAVRDQVAVVEAPHLTASSIVLVIFLAPSLVMPRATTVTNGQRYCLPTRFRRSSRPIRSIANGRSLCFFYLGAWR